MLLEVVHCICLLAAVGRFVEAQDSSASSTPPTATITNGTVIGTTTSLPAATAPVNKFLGIPFAISPPERFSPAQPADAFNGSFTAQGYSPACIQQFVYPEAAQNFTKSLFNYPPPPAGESEDCLYLNVFAPSTPPPSEGRAVLFWIFGGGFRFGSGTVASYDGSAFAAYNDVIVVTHNYRTNIFGFAASSDSPPSERNLGLLDQRMALQWVQDNIEAFGGDPAKVTIFGESAGSFSVDAHVTAFTTDDAPFRAAIMESGQVSYLPGPGSGENNDASIQKVSQLLNCTGDTLTCLREAPATTLQDIIDVNIISFGPVVDNYTYFANLASRRAAGQFAQVPTLIGTNANEGTVFSLGQNNLTAYVQTTFGAAGPDFVSQVLQAFPTNATVSDYDQVSNIQTLIIFQCGSAYLANQNNVLGIPTWRYFFNASFPNFSPLNGLLGTFHSAEIPLVFQTYPGGPITPLGTDNTTVLPIYLPSTPQEYALGQYMNWAWASFAKNPLLGPGWYKVPELGILGDTNGAVAGVELINSSTVDSQCDVFRVLYETSSGVSLPVLGSQ